MMAFDRTYLEIPRTGERKRDFYVPQRQLPSEGIGVLGYDKRGTGASVGLYTQNYLLLANDWIAAVQEAKCLAGKRAGPDAFAGQPFHDGAQLHPQRGLADRYGDSTVKKVRWAYSGG